MNVEAIIFLVGIFTIAGGVLFFITRLFYMKEIEKSPKAERSSIYIALGVLTYFASIFILGLNGQELIAKIMLIAISVFCIVGAIVVKKDND